MKKYILKCIAGYQRVGAWLRTAQVPGFAYTTCKFQPSCSEYAELAIERHGPVLGSFKALGRIMRCNPFTNGGIDFPS